MLCMSVCIVLITTSKTVKINFQQLCVCLNQISTFQPSSYIELQVELLQLMRMSLFITFIPVFLCFTNLFGNDN